MATFPQECFHSLVTPCLAVWLDLVLLSTCLDALWNVLFHPPPHTHHLSPLCLAFSLWVTIHSPWASSCCQSGSSFPACIHSSSKIHRPDQGPCSILARWPPWSPGPGAFCFSVLTPLALVPRGYLCTLAIFPALCCAHADPPGISMKDRIVSVLGRCCTRGSQSIDVGFVLCIQALR